MLCGFFVGVFTSVVPLVRIEDYGVRIAVITALSAVVWLAVMLSTAPESDAVLERFVRTVRPPGPGWAHLRQRFGVTPMESLPAMVRRFGLACGVLFGGLPGNRRLPVASAVEWLDRSVGAGPLDLAAAPACRCRAVLSRMAP